MAAGRVQVVNRRAQPSQTKCGHVRRSIQFSGHLPALGIPANHCVVLNHLSNLGVSEEVTVLTNESSLQSDASEVSVTA